MARINNINAKLSINRYRANNYRRNLILLSFFINFAAAIYLQSAW